jgi:hypothetical protein
MHCSAVGADWAPFCSAGRAQWLIVLAGQGILGRMRIWIRVVVVVCMLSMTFQAGSREWPMLAHDAARSGATPTEIQPPFERKWYRMFPEEGIMSGVQPVIAGGKVFVGTLHGTMRAIDAETGRDVWQFKAGGAILHAAAASGDKLFFGGADGVIYSLNAADGKPAWEVQTGSAVWNAPAVHEGAVFIGSRDHRLYAIEAQTGRVLWTGDTGGPLLCSPALDTKRGRVVVGSEDMRVYSFDSSTGELLWRSEKLPGVSMRGYHPVIAPDGSVLIAAAPAVGGDTFQQLLLEMVKEIFGDFASWRHSREENERIRAANFQLMAKPETYEAQLNYIRRRLTEEPSFQTFFVLDTDTGRQRFVAPIVYSESMNGTGAPAIVSPEGKVIVKYQALLRSRYEHYSPFMNVGYIDISTGHISPIMDQSRTYGWYDSLLLVHDEQAQLSLSGRTLINTHQDNVNAMDLWTLDGFLEPFCRNIHEPKRGEAISIWARLLRGDPLPPGKEWLPRGTAVYGGGSVLGVPVAVADDSFYSLPTHEMNAGAAIIAYRMTPYGAASKETNLLPEDLTDEEWKVVQDFPWDWDSLEARRLNHLLAALPGKVPGTRQSPLTADAAKKVAQITDPELDRIIWETVQPGGRSQPAPRIYTSGMKRDLAAAVEELISTEWQPLLFPAGKFPEESYRVFAEPTETLYTLALAYPYLDSGLQIKVKNQVNHWNTEHGPLEGPTGRRARRPDTGAARAAYDQPPEKLMKILDDIVRGDIARLYPIWLWAHVSGDWSKIEKEWPTLRELIEQRPNRMEEDCRNGYIAGLIAYCRIALRMGDEASADAAVELSRRALRERLTFELAHTRGGLIWTVPKLRPQFSRWHFLSPEVGRLLALHAGQIHSDLMATYVDHHRPTWWMAWNVETMMRNECPYELPAVSSQIFAARALILAEPVEKLALFIDRPWCKADEYYIQKLALALRAAYPAEWVDLRIFQGTPARPESE